MERFSFLDISEVKMNYRLYPIALLGFTSFGFMNPESAHCEFWANWNPTKPVRGKIIDEDTKQPVPNAILIGTWESSGIFSRPKRKKKVVRTRPDGTFAIGRKFFWGRPPAGQRSFTVTVSQENYHSKKLMIAHMDMKSSPYNWIYDMDVDAELVILMNQKQEPSPVEISE